MTFKWCLLPNPLTLRTCRALFMQIVSAFAEFEKNRITERLSSGASRKPSRAAIVAASGTRLHGDKGRQGVDPGPCRRCSRSTCLCSQSRKAEHEQDCSSLEPGRVHDSNRCPLA